MADIVCPRCLEPWDMDELHNVADEKGTTFGALYRQFRNEGCGPVFDNTSCKPSNTERSNILSELAYTLGDDVDGYAAMVEDFGLDREGEYG